MTAVTDKCGDSQRRKATPEKRAIGKRWVGVSHNRGVWKKTLTLGLVAIVFRWPVRLLLCSMRNGSLHAVVANRSYEALQVSQPVCGALH